MEFHILSILFLLAFQQSVAVSSIAAAEESLDHQIPKISIAHKKIPCQLEWTKNSNAPGSANQNQNYVTLFDSLKRIGRVKILGQYAFGLISHSLKDQSRVPTGVFFSSKENRFLQLTNFEFLTNPNNCHLSWEPMGVEAEGWMCVTPYCIGLRRNNSINPSFEICTPSNDSTKCFPNQSQNSVNFMDFEILRSVKQSLDYRLDDLQVVERQILDVVNFKGTDRILNKANVEVETSINQGSGKSQETGNEERHLTISGTNGANQETKANYSSNSVSESIGAARGLRVPPFTSVEACSTINLPVLSLPVKLLVSFFANNLNAQEIENILIGSGIEGPFVHTDNFTVQVQLERTVERGLLADLSVETKFYVNPVNILGSNSCGSISKSLNEVRQKQLFQLLEKINHKLSRM